MNIESVSIHTDEQYTLQDIGALHGRFCTLYFAQMADCILHFVCCALNPASFSTLSFSSTSGYITLFLIETNYWKQILFWGLVFSTFTDCILHIANCILHRLNFLVTSGRITPILIETNHWRPFNEALITVDLQRNIVQL